MPGPLYRRLPLLAIALAAAVGVIFLRDTLSLASLQRHHAALTALRDAHYILAVLGFMAAYAAMVALSLPGATVATLTGGLLFGVFPGMFINAAAAGSGAVVIYLAARMGFGADVARRLASGGGRAAATLQRLQAAPWSALFAVRLLPVVPFFLANLLPAFAGIGLLPYAVTTYLGILPGAFVLTSVGAGLSGVLAAGGTPDLSAATRPEILLPLAGLGLLAAAPLIWSFVKGVRRGGSDT